MGCVLLDQWRWDDSDGEGRWGPPPGCSGAVDLASRAQIEAAPTGQPRGWGLFVCEAIPADIGDTGGIVLATEDVRDARPDGKALDGWEALTGYRPQGDSLADLLWDQLTAGADPLSLDGCAPLVPTHGGDLELWLASRRIAGERFEYGVHPHTPKLAVLLRRQLTDVRAASLAGRCVDRHGQVDFEFHRKWADALCEKYAQRDVQRKSVFFAAVKPIDWPAGEALQPHETTYSDDFNRANSTDLGANWTEVASDAAINSNRMRAGATGNSAHVRWNSDLSSNDNAAEIDVVTASASTLRFVGPACRYDSAADTCYLARTQGGSSGNGTFRPAKIIAGTLTVLGAGSTQAQEATDKRIEAAGSTITTKIGGVTIESITDSSITTGTRAGIVWESGDPTVHQADNWSCTDLVIGISYPQLERSIRGLNRGLTLGRA